MSSIALVTLDLGFISLSSLIAEVALHEEFWEGGVETSSSASHSNFALSTLRCNLLWLSIQNCKRFLERLTTFSANQTYYIAYHTFTKICYVVIWLANLADLRMHFSSKEFDKGGSGVSQSICTMLDMALTDKEGELPGLTRQWLLKLKSMAAEIKTLDGEHDAMTMFALMLRPVISGYDRRIRDIQKSASIQLTEPFSIPTPIGEQGVEIAPLSSYISPENNVDIYESWMPNFSIHSADLQPDVFEDMVWDKLINDFTLPP